MKKTRSSSPQSFYRRVARVHAVTSRDGFHGKRNLRGHEEVPKPGEGRIVRGPYSRNRADVAPLVTLTRSPCRDTARRQITQSPSFIRAERFARNLA